MPEYKCHGCDESIDTGNVLIGRNQKQIEDSTKIILHAENIGDGSMRAVTDYAMLRPDSCVNKYFDKDVQNDLYDAKVIPFSDLEMELRG